LVCQSVSDFFGLSEAYREIQLEEFFILMKMCNFSYENLRNLPVPYRTWFIKRLLRERNELPKDQYGVDTDTPIFAGR
jgi:hypothetical protein